MSLMDYRISAKTNPMMAEKEETTPISKPIKYWKDPMLDKKYVKDKILPIRDKISEFEWNDDNKVSLEDIMDKHTVEELMILLSIMVQEIEFVSIISRYKYDKQNQINMVERTNNG